MPDESVDDDFGVPQNRATIILAARDCLPKFSGFLTSWATREGKTQAALDPHTRPATHRMSEKLAAPQGRVQYAKRKWLSEAPNAWIKEVLGFRRFSLRGLDGSAFGVWTKARGEWDLVCLALNIKRLGALARNNF